MSIDCFSQEVCNKLEHYVYRLIDPRTGQTFYVGQGVGNRVFAHIKDELKFSKDQDILSEKIDQIRSIRNSGLEVIHIIQRHGLTKKEADEVEAALIDAYPGLTNIQVGYHSYERGVANAETIQNIYSLDTYKERDDLKYMIIKTSWDRVNICAGSIYEATRYSWVVNPKRVNKIPYVLGVISGVVRGVYEVDHWELSDNGIRYEFHGKDAPNDIKNYFINKRIPPCYTKKGRSNPVCYHD